MSLMILLSKYSTQTHVGLFIHMILVKLEDTGTPFSLNLPHDTSGTALHVGVGRWAYAGKRVYHVFNNITTLNPTSNPTPPSLPLNPLNPFTHIHSASAPVTADRKALKQ